MQTPDRLTKHSPGSLRELFSLSFPLMLSLLSGTLMVFVDRVILARYSLSAMNAAGAAQMTFFVLLMGALGIATIAEVFVGQHNGAKEYDQTARPAWQMIWFSFFTSLIFFPVALFGASYIVSDYHAQEHGIPYFKWLLLFGPFFTLQGALSSFFVGIGHVKKVTVAAILGNLTNILLDILLIFGVSGVLEPMGTKGAALATGLSQAAQVLFLAIFFFSKKYTQNYGTSNFAFDFKSFWKCIKIGGPSAFGHMIEITAWACITNMLTKKGEDFITVMIIGQGLFGLISFTLEGIQKGVIAVCSNLIGAKKWDLLPKAWVSGVKLNLILAILTAPFLLFFPEYILSLFLNEEVSAESFARIAGYIDIVSLCILCYFILDGITWISAGVLTSAGKTFFVMAANGINTWIFALTPIYIALFYLDVGPATSWVLLNVYAFVNALSFFIRYRLLTKHPENALTTAEGGF